MGTYGPKIPGQVKVTEVRKYKRSDVQRRKKDVSTEVQTDPSKCKGLNPRRAGRGGSDGAEGGEAVGMDPKRLGTLLGRAGVKARSVIGAGKKRVDTARYEGENREKS
jgi:hypothetical protein